MDRRFEPDVFRLRTKLGAHDFPVGFKPELQSNRVGFSANKTRAGVRQWLHDHSSFYHPLKRTAKNACNGAGKFLLLLLKAVNQPN